MANKGYDPSSPYGYTPTAWASLLFTVLFAASGLVHIAQAAWFKYWIVFPSLAIGALLEVVGWAARYWSSQNVLYDPPFLQQIITLIIAPVFISAYLYTLLGIAIKRLGPQYSFLKPKQYIIVFVVCDVISLVLQAIGGGWAASAHPAPKSATNLMVGGIIFQLVSMVLFSCLAADFIFRTSRNRPYAGRVPQRGGSADHVRLRGSVEDEESYISGSSYSDSQVIRGWERVMIGICLASIMIIIRGVYRSVELVQGWTGFLILHEVYQDTLDGIPMFLALLALNVFHPGWFLPKRTSWKGESNKADRTI